MSDRPDRRGRPRRTRSRRPDASLVDKWFPSRGPETAGRDRRSEARARQLCRQVQRQLELALGELDDPVLDGIAVLAVEPGLTGGTLCVHVVVPHDRDPAAVHAGSSTAQGRLRSEIAAAIHRKRTPHLDFVLVPAGAACVDEREADDDR